MNAHIKPPTTAPNTEIEWVLARARCMSAGLRLVQFEIDEIGISLKNGWVTPEYAASCLATLEQLPCYAAAIFYSSGDAG
jgi:hypothetical protein